MRERGGLVLRLAFLALLGGGLVWWSQDRRPRDLTLELDLTQELPGDIQEVDLTVWRGGHALTRKDIRYGATGAPGLVVAKVHAAPGVAELEATLVYAKGPARLLREQVKLSPDAPARVVAK